MSPMINEALVSARIEAARDRASHRRLARTAKNAAIGRSTVQVIRDAVGLGLIAIGERLVDQAPNEKDDLRRAA